MGDSVGDGVGEQMAALTVQVDGLAAWVDGLAARVDGLGRPFPIPRWCSKLLIWLI